MLIKNSDVKLDSGQCSQSELTNIFNWLDSCVAEDWFRDAKSSRILYRCCFGSLVSQLGEIKFGDNRCSVKLVMTMNGRHSSIAAELLVEGLDSRI